VAFFVGATGFVARLRDCDPLRKILIMTEIKKATLLSGFFVGATGFVAKPRDCDPLRKILIMTGNKKSHSFEWLFLWEQQDSLWELLGSNQ
jgi:hypothetical protein